MKINLSTRRSQVLGIFILFLALCGLLAFIALLRLRIAFDRQIMLLLTPEPHFFSELYLINADGSGQMRLTNNLDSENEHIWSPDGQQIAFVWWHSYAKCQLYVMNIDDGQLINLTQNLETCELSPAWSPDSRRIAFVSERDGNPEIYTINADGSQRTRLTDHPAEDESPTWSPDGRRLAFVSLRDGNREIFVMNANGSQKINLTNNTAGDWDPAWSPDGQQLAFTSVRDGNREIYVMNADGSQQINITNAPFTTDDYPRWSPDGQLIGFRSDRQGPEAVYVAYANGGGEKDALKDNLAFKQNDPVWSPDGQRIAFEVFTFNENDGGQVAIHLINTDGTRQVTLNLLGIVNAREPAWSPDSRRLLFTADPDEK